MLKKFIFTFLFILVVAGVYAQPCNLQGVYKIGSPGNYTTIYSALTALRTTGVGGPVILEIDSSYTGSGEVFPLAFDNIPCISAANTVTLRPALGATNIVLSANSMIVSLINSRYITIDGRPGGIGSAIELTLSSISSINSTVVFQNDGSNNTIKYTNILGVNNSVTGGVISFLTSTLSNGNNNNIISYCRIGGNSTSNPVNGIYSEGSNNKKNTNNKIQHCAITEFYATGITACGILLNKNSSDWEISSNSFFQNPFAFNPVSDITGIQISDTMSSNFIIKDNFIGGTDTLCQGAPFSIVGTFNGIVIASGNQSYSGIQNNSISNIDWQNQFTSNYLTGIHIIAGKINCGTVAGNTIGSITENASITTTANYLTAPDICGIMVGFNSIPGTINQINIENNYIAGIKCISVPANYLASNLYGIYVNNQNAGLVSISNNQIGSATLFSSLENNQPIGEVKGISIQIMLSGGPAYDTYPIANTISGNTIRHLNGQATGIDLSGGVPQVINNTIQDLYSELDPGSSSLPYAIGINAIALKEGSLITENHLHSFITKGNFGGSLRGIVLDLSRGVEISKNKINSFQMESLYDAITGIYILPSLLTNNKSVYRVINNMINLGVDTAGNLINQPNEICGIKAPLDSTFISHNSIYIAAGIGDNEADAIFLSGTNGYASRITNNILVNLRSQVSSNSFYKNFAINFDPSIISTGGITLNNNLYQVSGTGTFLGSYNGVSSLDLFSWQNSINLDLNSLSGNPNFNNPQGTDSTSNLHLVFPSLADAAGLLEPTILVDVDNDIRALLTPVDIGADAINGSLAGVKENHVTDVLYCYPNPASSSLTVESNTAFFNWNYFEVIDCAGRVLLKRDKIAERNRITIDINMFPSGAYTLHFKNDVNESAYTKFIKQ